MGKYVLLEKRVKSEDGSIDEARTEQIKASYEESYNIINVVRAIFDRIYVEIQDSIDNQYTENDVLSALKQDGSYGFALNYFSDKDYVIIRTSESTGVYILEKRSNGIFFKYVFRVSEIEPDDVGYLVIERFTDPNDRRNIIERCCHPIFDKYFDADRFSHNLATENGVFVIRRSHMERSEWYQSNMKVLDESKQYGIDLNTDKYKSIKDTDELLFMLRCEIFEDDDRRSKLTDNSAIYMHLEVIKRIDKFLDEDFYTSQSEGEQFESFDELCDYLGSDDFEDGEEGDVEINAFLKRVSDQAIIYALISADDESDFNAVHKALGPAEFRIGCLTDDIYNEHPDQGGILCSRYGDLRWFDDIYALNEWEGASEYMWFGKFQANEEDVLLCFREFHPELIVDRMPSNREVSRIQYEYKINNSRSRSRHREMSVSGNTVSGLWYPKGTMEDESHAITFDIKYNSIRFTQDECKTLLSGEEIFRDKYLTNCGDTTTMRGKLDDVSNPYEDDDMIVQFVRTDVGGSDRLKIDEAWSIAEPGLGQQSGGESDGGGLSGLPDFN